MAQSSGEALAEESDSWRDDPYGKRFVLGVGLYAPKLDTQIRRDSSNGMLGTLIDFESTLGMDDKDRLPLLLGYYRLAKKHRINFGYFRLNRRGISTNQGAIRFGDITFPGFLPLESYFNVDVYSLAVALYECLTLSRPFEAPTREALYQAIDAILAPGDETG